MSCPFTKSSSYQNSKSSLFYAQQQQQNSGICIVQKFAVSELTRFKEIIHCSALTIECIE